MATALYHDERGLWHSGGEQALFMPVGDYVQPPTATGFAENPETKPRFTNLPEVAGI